MCSHLEESALAWSINKYGSEISTRRQQNDTIYAKDRFQQPSGQIIATIPKAPNSLFVLAISASDSSTLRTSFYQSQEQVKHTSIAKRGGAEAVHLWHQRLGHLNERDLMMLKRTGATGIALKHGTKLQVPCELCIVGKMTRRPFRPSTTTTSRPSECVFSDIKELFRATGINGGWRYYVTYIDHFTRYTALFC